MRQAGTGVIFQVVVMGGSAGGFEALEAILSTLPPDFPLPILVVNHLHPADHGSFARHLASILQLSVGEPSDKEQIVHGRIYVAPANYHMLVERNKTIALAVDEKVNWSRPSIDVLFESASRAFGESVIAVILSGANADGTKGMSAIRGAGGLTIAQDPSEAATPLMPQSAIDAGAANEVLRLKEIGKRLIELTLNSQLTHNELTMNSQ
ncbi:MAG: chemotaxis protein CheB [Candidatus Ozemobacteraceae bacterium]